MFGAIFTVVWAFIKAMFGVKADPSVAARQQGVDEQSLADQGAAYDTLAKAADARADADTQRVLGEPDSGKVDPNATKDFPGVEFRD